MTTLLAVIWTAVAFYGIGRAHVANKPKDEVAARRNQRRSEHP